MLPCEEFYFLLSFKQQENDRFYSKIEQKVVLFSYLRIVFEKKVVEKE